MHAPNIRTATWRKSSYSSHNGSCVEVALTDTLVGVRDSKNTDAGHLTLCAPCWTTFISTIKGN